MVKGFRWGGGEVSGRFLLWVEVEQWDERCGERNDERVCVYGCMYVRVCVCVWWGVGGGGAMLMSAPFYSLTSRSNYLAYPGSSINVF